MSKIRADIQSTFQLLKPSLDYLPSYKAALEREWGPDNTRVAESAREELQKIAQNSEAFVRAKDDPDAKAGPVTLPDGSTVNRLPGFNRWMWDGEFCGNVGFRWQPGTTDLPPTCLGHIGYSVVPWKQRHGYATRALGLLLEEIRPYRLNGLSYVEITTNIDNTPSQKLIVANGGVLVERFTKPAVFKTDGINQESFRYRITL